MSLLETYTMKIILVGDVGVGKSSILSTYMSEELKKSYMPTVGLNFVSKDI
jgi:GTPase SAR1 family protein